MDNASFGGVISSLELRGINYTTAHGSSGDETARCVVGQRLAVKISAFVLLTAPVLGCCFGAIFLSTFVGLVAGAVPESNVGTGFGVGLGDRKANTGGGTGNYGSLSLEGETLQNGAAIDQTVVVVDEVASVKRVEIRHFEDCV
ncbi:hypothetical protein HG530_013355 [Fusarium avenaceum]|nr:hypothetical protein HG530_013355 [Fusarium avenaceum]